jgi:hypothetical protein
MNDPRQLDDDKVPEKYFNFLGLVIVRKADLLAATAFVLATGSALYQAGGYLRGARLSTFAPDAVLLFFDHYSDGASVARLAGQVTFINAGQQGRDGTIREAWVDVAGLGFTYRQYWTSFPSIEREDESLDVEQVEDAHPLQIAGEGTVSKLVGFAPRLDLCAPADNCNVNNRFISDTEFLGLLINNVGKSIQVTFGATSFQSGSVAPSLCRVAITQALITYLAANDWYMARCAPMEGN